MSNMNMGPGGQAAPGGAARPGQMTAVMRAMAVQTGPKVLRIGLVKGGRVLEERVIKSRQTVTVGPSEKSTFVISNAQLAPQFKLFELIGTEYSLNFLDGMSGRVALATGITDLAALRGQAKRSGNAYQVKLTDDARGKVVIGDTTFLFQFVAPPPVQPRPQLPLAVQGGVAASVDWTLTIIAAFSFLLHFGVIGAMYSDWMDPPVAENSVQGLVDMMKKIQPPPIEEKPPEEKPEDKAVPDKTPDKTPQKAAANSAPAPAGAGGAKAPVSNAQAAALAEKADQMQMQMLAAFGGTSSVAGALNRSDIPPVDLSGAAAAAGGVAAGNGELKLGSGGGPVQGGKGGGGLQGIGGGTKGTGEGGGAGGERKVEGPKGDAQLGGTSMSVPVNGADRVIAGLRGRFRSCYQQGLSSDPTMSGKVVISAKVGPNGEVESANVSSNTGLSPTVASCIARAVKNAQFDAPGGGGSQLNIPVTFVQQAK
ncbi:MAG: AgmX/PglI C-terminal domain-containing protein [Polyangiaceae bacterium]